MTNARTWSIFLYSVALLLLVPWNWERPFAAGPHRAKSFMVAEATDISFQRESDESLPLSKNYRASLRKLCELLKSAESKPSLLPSELQSRKEELTAACSKLKKDDEMEKYDQVTSSSRPKLLLVTAVAGVLGGIAVFRKQLSRLLQSLYNWQWRRLWGHSSKSSAAPDSSVSSGNRVVDGQRSAASVGVEDQNLVREARLKRFGNELPQST